MSPASGDFLMPAVLTRDNQFSVSNQVMSPASGDYVEPFDPTIGGRRFQSSDVTSEW